MALYLCEYCGALLEAGDFDVSRWPGNEVEPPETVCKCPYCGATDDYYIQEVEICECCGNPIVRQTGKHSYETHSGVCDECGAEIDKALKAVFDVFGGPVAVFDRAEQMNWYTGYRGEKK